MSLKNWFRGCLAPVVLFSALGITAGCGGGGMSAPSPSNPEAANVQGAVLGTAKVHVDVDNGTVTVTPGAAGPDGAIRAKAVFTGPTVTVTSSSVIDEPGNLGLKVLDVSLKNGWGAAIGVDPNGIETGIRAVIGPITHNSANIGAVVSTLAGSGAMTTVNGPADVAAMNYPSGIVSDGTGGFLVTEFQGNRIRRIRNGSVTTVAGTGAKSSLDCNVAGFASFASPLGIANLEGYPDHFIVTDLASGRLRQIVHVPETGAFQVRTIRDGGGNPIAVNMPYGVSTVQSNGSYIHVVDYSGGIHIYRNVSPSDTGWVLTGYLSGPEVGTGMAGIRALDNTSGYVIDYKGNKIKKYNVTGAGTGTVTTIAGGGLSTAVDRATGSGAHFNGPCGIYAASATHLYITEYSGQIVRELLSTDNGFTWVVDRIAGVPGVSGGAPPVGWPGVLGSSARFNGPMFLTGDAAGYLYVCDKSNNVVRKIWPGSSSATGSIAYPITGTGSIDNVVLGNPDGYSPSTILGNQLPFVRYGQSLAPGETSSGNKWSFYVPAGIRSFEFDVLVEADTEISTPIPAVNGSVSGGVGSPSAVVASQFIPSFGITLRNLKMGIDGIVHVMSSPDNTICKFTNDTLYFVTTSLVPTSISGYGQFADYIPNGTSPYKIFTVAPVSSISFYIYRGDISYASSYNPMSCGAVSNAVISPGGFVYFIGGHQIFKAFPGAVIGPIAGEFNVTGTNDSPNPHFSSPGGLAIDMQGNIYVADTGNHRIRKMNVLGQVSTLAGSSAGYRDGLGTEAQFSFPKKIVVDKSGYIYVWDSGNYRIRQISPSGSVLTVAGTGTIGTTDGFGNAATFSAIDGMGIDPSGTLFITDANRIRTIQRVEGLN